MPDGYLMGAVSSELIPVMAAKNTRTGYSIATPSSDSGKTTVLAMSDGTLLYSNELSSQPGVWRVNGLERVKLADAGYRYSSMVEVPGGCVIGSYYETSPMYYYDKETDTLTNLNFDNCAPFDAVVRDGRVWLIVDAGSFYRVGELDVAARKFNSKGAIHTAYYVDIVCFTAEGVVLTYDTEGDDRVVHWHFGKGVSSEYSGGNSRWKQIGYVGGKLLLSNGHGGTGAALLDVSANTFTKYELGGTFKGILDPLAETKDYIWAGHNDGICRIAKSSGTLELAATGTHHSDESMDRYSSHEVDGGWLIAPCNYCGDMICYLERDTQKLTVMLSGIKGGSSGANSVWRLADGKYIVKQRAQKPLYLCNIGAKIARAMPGTENYSCVQYMGGNDLVAANGYRIVWYDLAQEAQTHEGVAFVDDARFALRAPDERYAIIISPVNLCVADRATHTSVCLFNFNDQYTNSLHDVYRRGKWLLIETSWSYEGGSSWYDTYALDMRTWRVYQVWSDRDMPYCERECEKLY